MGRCCGRALADVHLHLTCNAPPPPRVIVSAAWRNAQTLKCLSQGLYVIIPSPSACWRRGGPAHGSKLLLGLEHRWQSSGAVGVQDHVCSGHRVWRSAVIPLAFIIWSIHYLRNGADRPFRCYRYNSQQVGRGALSLSLHSHTTGGWGGSPRVGPSRQPTNSRAQQAAHHHGSTRGGCQHSVQRGAAWMGDPSVRAHGMVMMPVWGQPRCMRLPA